MKIPARRARMFIQIFGATYLGSSLLTEKTQEYKLRFLRCLILRLGGPSEIANSPIEIQQVDQHLMNFLNPGVFSTS